ncbi:MAG: protein kinase [Acidobacteriaceae bacterium]|nr:protein kinase [Acidobacteriaceae bacterium]
MIASRYREINALLDDLLEVPRHARDAALERACGSDQELRHALEGLLAAYESQDGFLDSPALVQLGEDQNARAEWTDLSGSVIGGYEILQLLGAGALAEVWLAKDKRLQRRVALKILRAKFVRDPRHVLRFEQEARAASKLSHPNIVTIYEIGESEGVHFIAQEFVDGVTLRKRLLNGRLPFESILEIGTQVAAALAAAHAAGVVHRDIKPENLMIRTDGLVKVLDFGIARLIEIDSDRENAWRSTEDNLTTPGLVLGTLQYMSPEQARGLPLDHRSDIFSFGIVLYEMAGGEAPFSGPTGADIMARILAEDPAPIPGHRHVPPDFERVIFRCLKKHREQRISSAEELSAQLAAVKLQREGRAFSSRGVWAAVGALVMIAILLGWAWRVARRGAAALPFDSIEMTRLTLPGPVSDAALAPDGKSVAYLLEANGTPSLWTRQLGSGADNRIATLEPGSYEDVVYSPGGAFVYYIQTSNLAGTLYRIALSTGKREKVLSDVTEAIAFSPDGRHIAFIRWDVTRWEQSLVMANADGSNARKLTTRRRPFYYSRLGLAWSHDGNSVFCLAGSEPFYTANAYGLVKIDVASGSETRVAGRSWAQAGSLISSVDGRMLIVAASEHSDHDLQLWRVSYPDGRVTRITRDLSNYAKLSLSANSQELLAIRRERTQDLWTMRTTDADRMREVSNGAIPGLNSAAWTRDGDIVYSASSGQFLNTWKMSSSGQNLIQLSKAAADQNELAATPDGRYLLYQAGGKIWRMNSDGSQARQLTTGNLDVHPDVSPDSRWVVYASFQGWSPSVGGRPMIWKVPIDGGEAIQVTKDNNSVPAVSPDGKLIACAYFLYDKPQSAAKIAVYPFAGGRAIKVFERPDGSDYKVYWGREGSSLEYIVSQGDVSNIWSQPLRGGEAAPITHFRADRLFFLSPSVDGKELVLGRGKEVTELVLITPGR